MYLLNSALILIAVAGSVPLFRRRVGPWPFFWTILSLIASVLVWKGLILFGPIAKLSPIIVVMFILPGFIILELVFPRMAKEMESLIRAPVMFALSLCLWTLFASFAYRVQMLSSHAILGMLFFNAAGLIAVLWFKRYNKDSERHGIRESESDSTGSLYFFFLIVLLVIISVIVGLSAEYQRYDFDTCTHLAGYHKIADGLKIIGGNPFSGPQYNYFPHYIANPWYLACGLSSRLANTSVTWLYVYLAAIMSPLFFLGFYSIFKELVKERWIALLGTIMMIGPWISKKTLDWGPTMGTFYLQFLPSPEACTHMILFPIWLAFLFRYATFRTLETGGVMVLLSLAAMGVHPEPLLLIPYSIGLVCIVSIYFGDRREVLKIFGFAGLILISAALLAYLIIYPIGGESLKDGWRVYDKADLRRLLSIKMWGEFPHFYAMHPKFLVSLDNIKNFIGCAFLVWYVGFTPQISIYKETGKRLPNLKVSTSRSSHRWYLAVILTAVVIGPYLILYNPFLVPLIAKILGSPLPIWLMEGFYETLFLVCKFGAVAIVVVLLMRSNLLVKYKDRAKKGLLIIVLLFGVIIPLVRPSVSNTIWGMVNRRYAASILDIIRDPFYKKMLALEKGVVAITMEQAEYLVMTTPHYVISSTRAIKERQDDNESIINFRYGIDKIKHLLNKYNCRYVVVQNGSNTIVTNGDFSKGTTSWDETISSSIGNINGQMGDGLQLESKGYASQIAYQNIQVIPGKHYELSGYVKGGSSGNEPFAIQVFRHNASGSGEYSIAGMTTGSWTWYSGVFKAKYKKICVVLRKNSATTGTMLFDTIRVREIALGIPNDDTGNQISGDKVIGGRAIEARRAPSRGPIDRFREHPKFFKEITSFDNQVIFEVINVK